MPMEVFLGIPHRKKGRHNVTEDMDKIQRVSNA